MRKSRKARSQGSVASLAFIACIPLVAAIGGFAVDCMHVNDAKGELQRATDAAALAGAEDLANYTGSSLPLSASSQSTANQEPLNFALEVATMNAVDGPIGLWSSSDRTINATISYDSTFGGPTNWPNRCDVTGQIYIHSLFAQYFGNWGQSVSTSSAAALSAVTELSNPGPLLVSLPDPDPSGRILANLSINSQYTVEIKDNQSSNSVWILNNGSEDTYQILHIADPSKYPNNYIPPISIGDVIKSDNGQKSAGKDFTDLLNHVVEFVVTSDSVGKDYLAKGVPRHPVVGFMALYVTSVDATPGNNGYSLTGTIVPVTSGTGTTTSTNSWVPYQARLIQ